MQSEQHRLSDAPLWVDSERRAVVFALVAPSLLPFLSLLFHEWLRRILEDVKTGADQANARGRARMVPEQLKCGRSTEGQRAPNTGCSLQALEWEL